MSLAYNIRHSNIIISLIYNIIIIQIVYMLSLSMRTKLRNHYICINTTHTVTSLRSHALYLLDRRSLDMNVYCQHPLKHDGFSLGQSSNSIYNFQIYTLKPKLCPVFRFSCLGMGIFTFLKVTSLFQLYLYKSATVYRFMGFTSICCKHTFLSACISGVAY